MALSSMADPFLASHRKSFSSDDAEVHQVEIQRFTLHSVAAIYCGHQS